jgi:hypothetical protein
MTYPTNSIERNAAERSTGKRRHAALEKLQAILPFLELCDPSPAVLGSRANQLGISSLTLRRWCDRFAVLGFVGLQDSARADRNVPRRFRQNLLAAAFVAAEHGRGKTASEIHHALDREWPLIGKGGPPPAYNTVLRFLKYLSVQP